MILGLIPARGGSKGIPRKNIKLLGGKPLIQWTIDTAKACWGIKSLVVSTDDEEIARTVRGDARVLMRPRELARDDTPMLDVIHHAIAACELKGDDIVLLLQPTSPFRSRAQIRHAIALLEEDNCDSVVSVREIPTKYAPEWALERGPGFAGGRWVVGGDTRPTRRQDLKPTYYRDGEIYAFKAFGYKDFPLIGRVILQQIDDHEPCNLDEPEDWAEAERRVASMLATA